MNHNRKNQLATKIRAEVNRLNFLLAVAQSEGLQAQITLHLNADSTSVSQQLSGKMFAKGGFDSTSLALSTKFLESTKA